MKKINGAERFSFRRDDNCSVLCKLARQCQLDLPIVQTVESEICVRLDENWPALLGSLADLGRVGLLAPHGGTRLIQTVPGLDFQQVPGTSELVDLANGGLIIDTAELGFALAVEEYHSQGSLVGIQFFNTSGQALFKVLAIPGSSFRSLGRILKHHAISVDEPEPELPAIHEPANTYKPRDSPLTAAVQVLVNGWERNNPFNLDSTLELLPGQETPGRLYPALSSDLAEASTDRYLAAYLINAHATETPLEVTAFSEGVTQRLVLVPRRLEQCRHGTHLLDENAQFLIPHQGFSTWRTQFAASPTTCVEFLDEAGRRRLAIRHEV